MGIFHQRCPHIYREKNSSFTAGDGLGALKSSLQARIPLPSSLVLSSPAPSPAPSPAVLPEQLLHSYF